MLKLKHQDFGHLIEEPTHWKRLQARGEGTTEDEMLGGHHGFNEHVFEQTPGGGEGSLVYCSPWGHKELDTTEQQQNAYINNIDSDT